ncbi:RDD protein [Campylobacter hyointestinalis subsp. hyointestinalis]|uniref:RDD protein n=2 Tax=Campylobacter hyointestinalis TaxID=198 RepID=A0A9W5EP75_CAMHY|nr:RDD protein [Campylobacter hyointestinalis subsp. hyointestinalis]CUU84389.1 RDD protein [Campylobacter hyointestinalis subsp. hyointestinalis]
MKNMQKQKAVPALIISRVKAFIVDMFLIAVPLLYVTTYFILDGKNDFQHNQFAIFGVWVVFGTIQSLFFTFNAQSPGYRSQNIYIINLSGKKAGFIIYMLRYFFFITTFIFGGFLFCFFRKDKRNLHDILSGTIPVSKKDA